MARISCTYGSDGFGPATLTEVMGRTISMSVDVSIKVTDTPMAVLVSSQLKVTVPIATKAGVSTGKTLQFECEGMKPFTIRT